MVTSTVVCRLRTVDRQQNTSVHEHSLCLTGNNDVLFVSFTVVS